MLVRRSAPKGALMAICFQMGVCLNVSTILWDDECYVNFDKKGTETVDLSYMFTEKELFVLTDGKASPEFLPGLEALLQPFISLEITRDLEEHSINNTLLKRLKLENHAKKKYFRALYGSMKLKRTYQMSFTVVANPVVTISGSFVLAGLELRFPEYNTTFPSGNYIGYNLAINTDLEIIFMVSLEPKGTNVTAIIHLEVSGIGPLVFSDNTNCELVEQRDDLNLGRICAAQALEDVTKWKGVRKRVIAVIKPAIFRHIWCSFRKIIPNLVEMTIAYGVLLKK
ncbi:hypothetical protein GE061_015860 [Apolygus lucorum]|uniref:Uncharacterized protein n=1 Tax=Apolygus lucorum TaxID=248454 RepID=A0A6A4J8N7_APOLU|nr:hypothetical protein GE061_015860 [Apolygus lucorum]